MKRWLVASLGVNLVLIGAFIGFWMTAALPPLPFLPPGKDAQGFERDMYQVTQILEPSTREKVHAFIKDKFSKFHEPGMPKPRGPHAPGGLLDHFVAGDVSPQIPPIVLNMHERRREEMHVIHEVMYGLSQMLTKEQRQKVAASMRSHIQKMDKCVNKP